MYTVLLQVQGNLLRNLDRIADYGPRFKGCGICSNIDGPADARTPLLRRLCESWPDGTGDGTLPVPGWYFDSDNKANMWNPAHHYGAARIQLLNWMRDALRRSIEVSTHG